MPRVPPLSLPAAMEQRPTVLLVDDEESIQKLLTYPLEREGYRVVQARDGRRHSSATAPSRSTWSCST